MRAFRLPLFAILAVVVLGSGGCERMPDPFVSRPYEFNREHDDFGKTPEDILEVLVCYNRKNTTRDVIEQLAVEECALVKKTARFKDHDLTQCPLTTPIGAVYACEGGPRRGDYQWSPNFLYYGRPPVPTAPLPETIRP